jgi:transcriptional regulator with XRE-family HTH domain
VTVGESLTQARYQAGLTIDELSERTKIRASVIRRIEADDYEACGGDLYVRGYVRAIAGAIGVDAQGLIREYDRQRVQASGDADATIFDLPAVAASDKSDGSDGPGASVGSDGSDGSDADSAAGHDPDETRFDLPVVREDFAATRFDIPPIRSDLTEDLMAAGYDVQPAAGGAGAELGIPSAGARPQADAAAPGRGSGTGHGQRRLLAGVVAVVVLAVAVVVGVRLASGSTTAKNTADSTAARAGASAKPSRSASPATSAAADTKPAATPTATPSAKPSPTQQPHVIPPVTLLPIAAAEAFGPGGLGDGDNPSGAGYVIASNPPLPWSTNWYASAKFGMLKSGTGLLLNLAHQATITSVRIDLTGYQGVNLQLKVADGTAPQDFTVVAAADNTGGTVRLTLRHPASARYLLIWFTLLPPNGAGQYQESVYHVLVNGRR